MCALEDQNRWEFSLAAGRRRPVGALSRWRQLSAGLSTRPAIDAPGGRVILLLRAAAENDAERHAHSDPHRNAYASGVHGGADSRAEGRAQDDRNA